MSAIWKFSFCLGLIFGPLLGSSVAAGPADDAAEVRQAFSRACGGKLRILDEVILSAEKDSLAPRKYWVIRVEPVEVGFYTLYHEAERVGDWGMYDRCKWGYHFKVVPRGTPRTVVDNSGSNPLACLGDRLTLVFNISARFKDHVVKFEFSGPEDQKRLREIAARLLREGRGGSYSIRAGEYSEHEYVQIDAAVTEIHASAAPPAPEGAPPVVNSLDPYLKCVSAKAGATLTAGLRRIPYVLMDFKATQATNVNLVVTLPGSQTNAPRGVVLPLAEYAPVLPLTIVSKDTPLEIFLKNASERWYNASNSGSSSGPMHELEVEFIPPALRVGDTLKLQIGGAWDSSTPIRCQGLPFAVPAQNPNFGYPANIYGRIKWKNHPVPDAPKGP